MDELSARYDIRVIDPFKLFGDAQNAGAAFERCLKAICDRTIVGQVQHGLDNLFSGQQVNPRTATDYEIEAVERAIDNEPFEVGLRAFRAEFDAALIAAHHQERVTDLFRKLVEKADPKNGTHISELRGAHFNFRAAPVYAVQATAYLMALCNRLPPSDGFDEMMAIESFALPKGSLPIAAALAIGLLAQRGEPITDNFRRLATYWLRGWEELEEPQRVRIKQAINAAWHGSGSQYQPILRSPFFAKDLHDIHADFLNNLAKRVKNLEL